jgi:putative ABC transport system permease protein
VEQVALVDVLPGAISQRHQIKILPEGSPSHQPAGYLQAVSPGYFETMDLRLVVGRPFSESDDASSQPVAIVNELYVRMLPGTERDRDVLGKRVRITSHPGLWITIVGVVENGPRNQSFPEVYVPYPQNAMHGPSWDVRAGEPSWYLLARATGEQRETVAAPLERALGLEFRTLEERLKAHLEVYEPK